MTTDDLRAWQLSMNFSNSAAVRALGVKTSAFADMLEGKDPIERVTALACAAVAAGSEPWGVASDTTIKQLHPKRRLLLPVHD